MRNTSTPPSTPASRITPIHEEERRILAEIEALDRNEPRLVLQRKLDELRARREAEESAARYRASPEFQAKEIAPRLKRIREIEGQYRALLRAVFCRLGKLTEEAPPPRSERAISLDELREQEEALAQEYNAAHKDLLAVMGEAVPQGRFPIPVDPPIAVDCSAHAIEWLRGLFMAGRARYGGSRQLPPIRLT